MAGLVDVVRGALDLAAKAAEGSGAVFGEAQAATLKLQIQSLSAGGGMLAAVATEVEDHPWLAVAGVALGAVAAFGAAGTVATLGLASGTAYLGLLGITVAESAVVTAVAEAVASFAIGYGVEELVHKLGTSPDIAKLVQGIGENVNGWYDGTTPAPSTAAIPVDYKTWGNTSGDEVFNNFNSSGASTGNIVIHPNGAHDDTSLDTANEQTWESKTDSYDETNRLTDEAVRNDNGTSTKSVFDTGTEAWSSQTSTFDAYQRLQSQRVVLDGGGQQVKEYDPNNTHPYTELDIDEDATGKITAAKPTIDGQPANNTDFSAVGQVLGSTLGRALAPNNQFVQIAASTVIGAVGQRLALVFSGALATDGSSIGLTDVFANFGVSIAGAGASSVASFLVAELGTELHLNGFGGQLFNAAAGGFTGSVANQVASQMARGVPFEAAIAGLDFGAAATNAAYGISALLGSYLGHELVPAQTHEGAVGGQLLGAVGSAIGISAAIGQLLGGVLDFILPGVGSLVGTVLGTLIGDAFGHPAHPAAVDLIDQAGYLYGYNHSSISASDGGGYEVPDPMAAAAVAIVNAYLHAVNGVALDHSRQTMVGYITDPQLYYVSGWVPSGAYHTNLTPDDAVHLAALDLLQHTEVIGGDLLMKRAHQNSPSNIPETQAGNGGPGQSQVSSAEQLVTMSGDLSTAQDYENCLNNREAINALIAANVSMARSRISCKRAMLA